MNLKKRLEVVEKNIEDALLKRTYKEGVYLVAATKTQTFETIIESYNLGIRYIGENRIQEALNKFKSFEKTPGLKKRFIGHLQKNKVNKCIDLFDTIDSVDNISLLKKINSRCLFLKKKIDVLLEINITEESQKKGFQPIINDELLSCFDFQNIKIRGLMTIGSYTGDEKTIRNQFSRVRELKDEISNQTSEKSFDQLSMGMSGDYLLAIKEGSTIIRLGTALYGNRK